MKIIATILIILSVCADCMAQFGIKLTDVGMGLSSTSVNTAIFRENAITTCRDTQFIAFYDPEGFLVLGKRALDADGGGIGNFILQKSQYKTLKINDAHNVISIAADGDGYIHVSFDQHTSQLRYCRSVAPYSLTLGELTPMVQGASMLEKNVTYPQFFNFKNGDLLFVYRNFNGIIIYYYSTAKRQWQMVRNRLLEFDFSVRPYWQIAIGDDDAIHLSWLWRDNVNDANTNHGIYYACSHDYGRSWQTADGKVMTQIFRRENTAPVINIPKNSNLINQTTMAVDENGTPYIATYYRTGNSTNYHLIYRDGSKFCDVVVDQRADDFSLDGIGTLKIPISRPRVVVGGGKIYYIIRDALNGTLPTMYDAEINAGQKPSFDCINLAADPLGAWEPLIDLTLWHKKHVLHLFMQETMQQNGDRSSDNKPTMVKILEITPRTPAQR